MTDNIPSKELLPCPFCGHEAELNTASNAPRWYIVSCVNLRCLITPQVQCEGRQEVVAAWNKRPAPETNERPDVNDVFRAGVTQAKYRFHYKGALQRMLDGRGSLSAAACLDIAREALATSPEDGDEFKASEQPKAAVLPTDICPTGDDYSHKEHKGKCLYCGAPMNGAV